MACTVVYLKKHFRKYVLIVPSNMLKVIQVIAFNTVYMNLFDMKLVNRKDVLNYTFNVPKDFRISGYHIFRSGANNSENLCFRKVSTTKNCNGFHF